MPLKLPGPKKSREGQTAAAKKPDAPVNNGAKDALKDRAKQVAKDEAERKSADRDARLTEALRENLRRRKAAAKKDD